MPKENIIPNRRLTRTYGKQRLTAANTAGLVVGVKRSSAGVDQTPIKPAPIDLIRQGAWTPSNQVFVGPPKSSERQLHIKLKLALSYDLHVDQAEHVCVVIQRWWRARLFQLRFSRLRLAVITLQRRFRHRKHTEKLAKVAAVLQRCWRAKQVRRTYLKAKLAAIMLQRRFRSRSERRHQAATKIQAIYRGWNERFRYQTTREAARILQRTWRLYIRWRFQCSALTTVRFLRQLFVTYSTENLNFTCMSNRAVQQLRMAVVNTAVSRFQANCRRHLTQRRLIILKRTAIQLQRVFRFRRQLRLEQQQRDMAAKRESEASHEATTMQSPQKRLKPETPSSASKPIDDEKLKQLMELRAKKEKLMTKLASGPGSARKAIPSPRVKLQELAQVQPSPQIEAIAPPPPINRSHIIELKLKPEKADCQMQTVASIPIPKEPSPPVSSMADVVLQNLSQLSADEVRKLTEMNTNMNRQYKRKLEMEVIEKDGPKPPSPNAKTLAKFAAETRTQGLFGEFRTDTKIKWKPNDELVTTMSIESCPVRAASLPPKPILKPPRSFTHADPGYNTDPGQMSPVRIQVFKYVEKERRLTMSAKRTVPRTGTKSSSSKVSAGRRPAISMRTGVTSKRS